jgi:site-specific DNA-methyltransferase (adenine-specific)
MSITATKLRTTTDWKTLNYCLSEITPLSIIQVLIGADGLSASANSAVKYFAAELSRLNATLELSVVAPVMLQARQNSLDVDANVKNEPIVVARKPLIGTVAANVLQYGTGALNIDACRVRWPDGAVPEIGTSAWGGPAKKLTAVPGQHGDTVERTPPSQLGRWPANVIHDGSDEVLAAFPDAPGQLADVKFDPEERKTQNAYGVMKRGHEPSAERSYVDSGSTNFAMKPGARRLDKGSAARFFYCAKASREERNRGCESLGKKPLFWSSGTQSPGTFQAEGTDRSAQNNHPTVKPIALMAYLCRLVTPAEGVVLDLFMGSGSTGIAAQREGFDFIGIEINPAYVEIARLRIEADAPLFNNVASGEEKLTTESEA